jgi:hypothetical protein
VSAEAVQAGLTAAEVAASLVLIVFSSRISSSSSSVTENDDLAVAGWPKDVAVEVTKKFSSELLIPWDISNETFLIKRWRKIHHMSLARAPLLKHRWARVSHPKFFSE